ncbi:MAG: hypothetical protein IKG93_07045 [Clostridiales bacterium]|nr:hypothetical protein [Clostridiales bacterium]
MLAIIYLIIAIFFGIQLIRLLIPDIRRLYVGVAPDQSVIEKVPTSLFLIPAGTLVGIVLMTFTTYFLAYIMYPFIPADTTTLLPADIMAMCIFTYLGCLFWQRCFIRNYRKIKAGVELNKLSPFNRHPGSILFYSMTVVLVLIALAFVYFYTCHNADGKICLGYSIFSDFSPHVAITSGFGVGSNFPTQYPHFSGDNIQYHFMFYFLTGNMEALGLPLIWAINIPSLICMLSTLTLLGTLAVLLSGRRAAYFFAPLLVLFRSAWNVFHQAEEIKEATGVSWGEVIKTLTKQDSWYSYTFRDEWGLWAINVYANQRHLCIGIGIVVLFIFLFLPHFRRMFLHLTRTEGFGAKCKRFFASREAWIHRKDDPFNPWGAIILLSLVAAAMPFFHGSCLISALLVLFGMAIFSEFRLGYAVIAAVSVISSVIQAKFFAGGAENVATFKYYFGFVVPEIDGKNKSGLGTALGYSGKIISYLNKMGFLTVILPCVIFFGLLIYELVKRRNPYRAMILIPFSFPLIFAFYCQASLEVLANHKFIQVSFILFDILIAGLLANLLALPIKIKENLPQPKNKKKKNLGEEKVFALQKKTFIPVQIVSAVICLFLIFGLTATGVSEWFIYYNLNSNKEHHYVELDPNAEIVDWVKKNTDEDDVFLTPMWSTNDFFLSGRRVYYGWPYFAWSAGHDTETRQINYQWLLSGANGNIDEFRRYCGEMNIKYVIACGDYYGPEETDGFYNPDFFAENLKEAVRFEDGMIIYKV